MAAMDSEQDITLDFYISDKMKGGASSRDICERIIAEIIATGEPLSLADAISIALVLFTSGYCLACNNPSGYGYWGGRMPNSLAAFHMSAPDTPRKVWMSSLQVLTCRLMVTSISATGFMQAPLTVRGLISDSAKLPK